MDATASRQFDVRLAVVTSSGDAADFGGGAGSASLDDSGTLLWDVRPALELDATLDTKGLSSSDMVTGDGVTPDGCGMYFDETTSFDAVWTDGGGFAGTLSWAFDMAVCDRMCSVTATYDVVATPR